MSETTERSEQLLPKTEQLEEVLNLISLNAQAYGFVRNSGRLMSSLRKGFEELSELTEDEIYVETETNGKSFIVRNDYSRYSRANNYVLVENVRSGSEVMFKIRVQPDGDTDSTEKYLLSLNSLGDAFILKPQIQADSNIIKSNVLLDSLFFEKVMKDFMTAVHEARMV